MNKYTRREFIKNSIGSAAILGACGLFNRCDKGGPDAGQGSNMDAPINAQVAAVKGNDLYDMTRQAINAIGGMESVVNPGEVVFIKPNFVSFNLAENRECFRNGECTKPDILIATAEACLIAGAQEVIIGDGSQKITYSWEPSYTLDGSTNLVTEAARLSSQYDGDVSLACLESDYPGNYQIPTGTDHDCLYISNIYAKADRIITVPVAKTHNCAQLTLGCKNFVGVLSIARYGILLQNTYWDRGLGIDHTTVENISRAFLDVVAAKKPDLSIIDFSIGVEGNGPTAGSGYGSTVDVSERLGSWVILASKDIMAADATAARMMNHHVPNIKQLTMGYAMGLGEIREESIEIIGDRLANLRMSWRAAELVNQIGKRLPYSPIAQQFGHAYRSSG